MESRIHRRTTRHDRPTTRDKPFGNSRSSGVRWDDVDSLSSIDRLWTVDDVSAYLGVPVKTLYQWKWRGEGPPVRKIGRYLRYEPAAVKRWVTKAA
jgi:predicted DNA-binding transcriptional regulator AlpA